MLAIAIITGICLTLIGYFFAVEYGKEEGAADAMDRIRIAYEEAPTETLRWLQNERQTLPSVRERNRELIPD